MINTILVAVGALIAATCSGALLTPADVATWRTVLALQWQIHKAPLGARAHRSHAS